MLVARGYRINLNDWTLEVSVVMFGYSESVLRYRMGKKPNIKKITLDKVKPQHEATIIAEGLVTRARMRN
jgi:hypothetical protein